MAKDSDIVMSEGMPARSSMSKDGDHNVYILVSTLLLPTCWIIVWIYDLSVPVSSFVQ